MTWFTVDLLDPFDHAQNWHLLLAFEFMCVSHCLIDFSQDTVVDFHDLVCEL